VLHRPGAVAPEDALTAPLWRINFTPDADVGLCWRSRGKALNQNQENFSNSPGTQNLLGD
jgi:hypothetical protein